MFGGLIITLLAGGFAVMIAGLIRDCWFLRRATRAMSLVPPADKPADAPTSPHVDSHGP